MNAADHLIENMKDSMSDYEIVSIAETSILDIFPYTMDDNSDTDLTHLPKEDGSDADIMEQDFEFLESMAIKDRIDEVKSKLKPGTQLLAVSKYHPKEAIQEAYDTAGQRLFAESHAQELVGKYEALPKDIKWHFIGHLQTNKVKYIVPFVELIHSVDSEHLLAEIDKQAKKVGRVVKCLLEVHIAEEETKYGFSFDEVKALYDSNALAKYENVEVVGLMGMATATDGSDL